jgi:hypothetical protein
MKTICFTLALAFAAATAFAQSSIAVRWHQIVGVITAPGVDNPITGANDSNGNPTTIHSGAGPWTTRGGSARINLSTGEGAFDVEGLVMNGGAFSGTPGPVKSVEGTLVCSPNSAQQAVVDTTAVELSSTGNAELSFKMTVPPACTSPLFLIRIPASGKWIAAGAVAVVSSAPSF